MIQEEIRFVENEIERLQLDLKILQTELMNNDFTYYHGHDGHSDLGTQNELYNFWVYPPTMKLQSKWDTHLDAIDYCNNHRVLDSIHWYAKENGLKQYVCLGHKSIDDFKNAHSEWTRENITRPDIGIYEVKTKKQHIENTNNNNNNDNLHEALKPIVRENLANTTLFILGSLLLLMFLALYQPKTHKMLVLSSREVDL
jgi:hypothetical protein